MVTSDDIIYSDIIKNFLDLAQDNYIYEIKAWYERDNNGSTPFYNSSLIRITVLEWSKWCTVRPNVCIPPAKMLSGLSTAC